MTTCFDDTPPLASHGEQSRGEASTQIGLPMSCSAPPPSRSASPCTSHSRTSIVNNSKAAPQRPSQRRPNRVSWGRRRALAAGSEVCGATETRGIPRGCGGCAANPALATSWAQLRGRVGVVGSRHPERSHWTAGLGAGSWGSKAIRETGRGVEVLCEELTPPCPHEHSHAVDVNKSRGSCHEIINRNQGVPKVQWALRCTSISRQLNNSPGGKAGPPTLAGLNNKISHAQNDDCRIVRWGAGQIKCTQEADATVCSQVGLLSHRRRPPCTLVHHLRLLGALDLCGAQDQD